MKKKLLPLICALVLACALSVSLVACNPTQSAEAHTFVSLDINPSIELTLDGKNNVVSVYGANEDAQVLLYGEDGIVGVNVDVAIEKITRLAIDLGYINENNTVVETSVTTSNGNSEEIMSKINATVTATAQNLNMSVSCTGAEAYSLLRKLDNYKAKYPDNAAVQALTPDKLKIVVSATETGEISFEAAVELDEEEIVKLISDAHKKAEQFTTDAYNKAVVLANDAYEKALGAAMDGVYAEFYLENIIKHLDTAYYGVSYQAYKTGARGLNAVADALEFVENICDTPLDEDQIAAISEALGLGDDVSALKNSNGDITVKSVEAYADKLFKNSQASAELDAIKAKLTAAINETESKIQEAINEKSNEYKDQINAATQAFDTAKSYLEALADGIIPSTVKEQINLVITDFNEITTAVAAMFEDGKITSTEVRELATLLETKSNTALEKINADLTDDERATIAARQEEINNSLASVKAETENAIAQAEQSAKDYLASLKAQRIAE